jgi:hypothetical protein
LHQNVWLHLGVPEAILIGALLAKPFEDSTSLVAAKRAKMVLKISDVDLPAENAAQRLNDIFRREFSFVVGF